MDIDRTRPSYLVPDDVDALARQNTNLMTELWIVKDRLAMLETMLEQAGIVKRTDLENQIPSEALEDELAQEREAYIKRVIGLPPEERTVENLKKMAIRRDPA